MPRHLICDAHESINVGFTVLSDYLENNKQGNGLARNSGERRLC